MCATRAELVRLVNPEERALGDQRGYRDSQDKGDFQDHLYVRGSEREGEGGGVGMEKVTYRRFWNPVIVGLISEIDLLVEFEHTTSYSIPYSSDTASYSIPYSSDTASYSIPYSSDTASYSIPYSSDTASYSIPYSSAFLQKNVK